METENIEQAIQEEFNKRSKSVLAAFDSHRGLDSLGDFLVQAEAYLHRFLPSQTAGTAGIVGVKYSGLGSRSWLSQGYI